MIKFELDDYRGTLATRLREEGREKGLEEGREKGLEEGLEEGLAKALLLIVANRKLDLTDDNRARITSCTDPEQLETWISRATVAPDVSSIFND